MYSQCPKQNCTCGRSCEHICSAEATRHAGAAEDKTGARLSLPGTWQAEHIREEGAAFHGRLASAGVSKWHPPGPVSGAGIDSIFSVLPGAFACKVKPGPCRNVRRLSFSPSNPKNSAFSLRCRGIGEEFQTCPTSWDLAACLVAATARVLRPEVKSKRPRRNSRRRRRHILRCCCKPPQGWCVSMSPTTALLQLPQTTQILCVLSAGEGSILAAVGLTFAGSSLLRMMILQVLQMVVLCLQKTQILCV